MIEKSSLPGRKYVFMRKEEEGVLAGLQHGAELGISN
jgi:hypothetical protein